MYRFSIFRRRDSCISRGAFRINQHLDQRNSAILIRHIELNTDQKSDPFNVDKKLVAKFKRRIEKLHKLCESPRIQHSVLSVKTPPYILTTLGDVAELLSKIFRAYELSMYVLNSIEYFNATSQNLLTKLKQIARLLESTKVCDEGSQERENFFKLTLILSHIRADLNAMFPENIYEGAQYRIASPQAADFWRSNFGERTIIAWHCFEETLNRVHRIGNPLQAAQLSDTIQITQSSHVSIFEFNTFTRLFAPWHCILTTWRFLVTKHPAFVAFTTHHQANNRLKELLNKPGSFLFRPSCTKLGQWTVMYVTHDNRICHILSESIADTLVQGLEEDSLLFPNGKETEQNEQKMSLLSLRDQILQTNNSQP
jgi:hypothetical protein